MMPSALATGQITIAGVQLHNGFRSNGATTTFLSSDPFFGFPSYQLQPGIRAPLPSVGVNFPSLASGNLPGIGSLEVSEIFYDVPNLGPPADAGLRYFVQTSDGFLHTATSTSAFFNSGNGVNVYLVAVVPLQFSPLITRPELLSKINIRYASNAAGTIIFVGAILEGTEGIIDSANFNTVNDTQFNN